MRQQVVSSTQVNAMSQQQDEQHVGRGSKRRAAPLGQGNELIGAIDQGTSSTRFLVFERGTGSLVASSQLEIKRITPREGWVEIDPNAIMSSVYATMANVHDQLEARQFGSEPAPCANQPGATTISTALTCIGICNQRESAVVWDAKTGRPLYNVIVWMDNRTKDIVDDMIDSIPGRDFNRLKDKTGLPMSTYFSAFKLRWLIDNVPEVQAALRERRLLVGTVDSWILWNLTGRHLTDVTNASRTFLMDIETLQWDKALCKQFKVPMEILPKILSSADDFGALQFGPFMGTPVTGVIGDQSAALFGHNCLQLGQTKATFGTGCFIMQNIGPGPLNGALSGVQREAKRGLITTVGYKLRDRPVCYALEGSIKIAGAALTWLRDNMQLIENYEECDQLVNTTTNSAGVFFVPALGGLYSPYWDPNAAGLFIGLSQFTRREHLVRATFDSIAFQTNDILSLMRGVANGLMIDGGLCKSDNLCQILADITGCDINRPSMCETSALGAAMVAGCGAGIWDYESMLANSNEPHDFACSSHQNHHYPHESLNYDESKFNHSLHHQANGVQAKCFKASPTARQVSGEQQQQQQRQHRHHNHHNHHQQQQQNSAKRAVSQEIQHLAQPAKHQRRSLRHRYGGRLMRNLDAGGGINDDAGGGGGGGGGPMQQQLQQPGSKQPEYSSDEEEDEEEEEGDASSSGGHLASSDTDFDAGALVLVSESSSAADLAPRGTITTTATSGTPLAALPTNNLGAQLPAVIENHAIEGSFAAAPAAKMRTLASLVNHGAPASSSGYSSADNFDAASTSCQLTDSLRLLSEGRTDSPVSQATTGDALTLSGRDSGATCTEDLSISAKRHILDGGHASSLLAAQIAADSSADSTRSSSVRLKGSSSAFPFNLTNYMGGQPPAQTEAGTPTPGQNNADAPAAQQVNNRQFVEKAEDVADEVHEFGGRDSYGEDGYDSSTVSFDSYDDPDDDPGDDEAPCAELAALQLVLHEAKSAHYPDAGREADECQRHYDAISAKSVVSAGAGSQQHHHNHRRRQASLAEKQMDVFQPYISLEHRTELVDTWRSAVSRSMQWTKVHHEEVRRIDYQRLSSLPISMYVFFSIGLVALSSCLSPAALAGR